MISIIQLVSHANVQVNNEIIGAINQGIVALIGLEKTDTAREVEKLFTKITTYRIFPDEEGKTNLSLIQVNGGLLLVPQFTLVADTSKGTRPGFSTGMPPEEGRQLFDYFLTYAKTQYDNIAAGKFGANMQVTLCNDGPMTFQFKV